MGVREIWKLSVSMEGYEVSNYGNVRNARRQTNLTPTDNGNGYLIVAKKYANKRKKNFYVHRLVAECFCENTQGYDVVNHKDCDKRNNCADNLEWCTTLQNIHHAMDSGRIIYTDERRVRLEANRKLASKAHEKPVIVVHKNWSAQFKSLTEASKALGVTITTVSRVARGQCNTCAGAMVRFA